MLIYLASRFSRIVEMRGYRSVLEGDGHVITSRWLDEGEPGEGDDSYIPSNESVQFAIIDITDVARSELILSFTEPPRAWTRGGRHVEFGLGLAWGKEQVIVGPKENVFHTIPSVKQFESFDWARMYLKELDETWKRIDGPRSPMTQYLTQPTGPEAREFNVSYSSPDHVTGTIPPLSKMS